ncbi:MAG: hypothetical protein JWN02_2131 [Acidobacteria bacterium]|nr:hypothetical protein [Acidobacteriota bacterium]
MDVRYETLEDDIVSGVFKARLEIELTAGFRLLHEAGERLPPASHYAARIAEIVGKGAQEPLSADLAFHAYQEILAACEEARAKVLGEEVLPS